MLFKKIDNSSASTITSALNFFDTPGTNVAISNSSVREYLTLNPLTFTPYHFKLHPISSYIDLSKVCLNKILFNVNIIHRFIFIHVWPYIGWTMMVELELIW
jgi:hypothetical protein